nr:hypothetical protein BaRGS_026501 [Batillaria attramentaria]
MKQNEANCTVLAQKLHEAETRLTAALREKDSLQQTLDSLRGKDTDVEELNQKCRSLEIERDKAAQQELAELKEKQGDNLSADAPPEVLKEVTHLRQVIDSLKKMVLAQRSYLSQMGMVGGRVENMYSGQIMSTGQNMMPGTFRFEPEELHGFAKSN